jgi:hypothetical protein
VTKKKNIKSRTKTQSRSNKFICDIKDHEPCNYVTAECPHGDPPNWHCYICKADLTNTPLVQELSAAFKALWEYDPAKDIEPDIHPDDIKGPRYKFLD